MKIEDIDDVLSELSSPRPFFTDKDIKTIEICLNLVKNSLLDSQQNG